jgi:hypothetical protein
MQPAISLHVQSGLATAGASTQTLGRKGMKKLAVAALVVSLCSGGLWLSSDN